MAAALAALLVAAMLAGACQVQGSVLAEDTQSVNVETTAAPHISIETFNGRITLTAGFEGKIEMRITRRGSGNDQAEADADLAKVEVTVDDSEAAEGRVTVVARRTDRPLRLGDSGADMELSVPPRSSLDLRTSNGRIESSNVEGSIIARSSNGAITIRRGDDVDAETTNAPITATSVSGELRLRTSNGAIDIVEADDAVVSARTINGTVSFSGAMDRGEHAFTTTNAAIALTLPADAAFDIEASTTNAAVRTDFEGLVVGDATLSGTVGEAPLITIRAETTNGTVEVSKAR